MLLAIIHALTTWKHLLGAYFTVQTDHQFLRYFFSQVKLFEKHMGQLLIPVHFQIVHVDEMQNVVADAMFRKAQVSTVSIAHHDQLEAMKGKYAEDEDFAQILDHLSDGQSTILLRMGS